MALTSPPPLSLYVHLPWCVRKCPYCDFNSFESSNGVPEHDYVEALLRDLQSEAEFAAGRPLRSVFIGGGTPSLFSGAAVRRLLDGIRAELECSPHLEITLEANPGAAEAERFEAYAATGVNRLSIGVQSFRDAQLRALGRVHGADEAFTAVAHARRAGFANINIDLMYGLPGDEPDASCGDLETALGLGPTHLSWYQLTLEPNTAFHRRPPELPDDDTIARVEERGRAVLAANGYERYEVSAYARPGFRCAHNLNYWEFGDYLGIGAGAHGKLTLPREGRIERRAKARNPRTYMLQAGTAAAVSVERIESASQLVLEFMLNALRLPDGISLAAYRDRTGQPVELIEAPLAEAVRRGWMVPDASQLRATPAGLETLNAVLALF